MGVGAAEMLPRGQSETGIESQQLGQCARARGRPSVLDNSLDTKEKGALTEGR